MFKEVEDRLLALGLQQNEINLLIVLNKVLLL